MENVRGIGRDGANAGTIKGEEMSEYIDREAAIQALCKLCLANGNCGHTCRKILALEAIPAADVRPVVKGKWVNMGDFCSCSACSGTRLKEINTVYGKAIWIKYDFCPNCGAEMKEET